MATYIYVNSWPRSGTTWLLRTLWGIFYADMREDYSIYKSHYTWKQYQEKRIPGSKVVLIWRDPRDMVVSNMYFFGRRDIDDAIDHLDGYRAFVDGWLAHPPDFTATYERMHTEPFPMLSDLYRTLTGNDVDASLLRRVIEEQTFDKHTHLPPRIHRKGIVGDWRNHFTPEQLHSFEAQYGDVMERLDYA